MDPKKQKTLVLAVTGAAHVGITALTWQDLRHRPAAGIRGPRTVWRVLSAANTLGSAAYWTVGRRR